MPACYHFGPDRRFELEVAGRALRDQGRATVLGARAFDVLTALVERQGGLVTKDELMQRAWPGLVVEEANIHVQVSHLRKLLGAEAIATIAGSGYRFALSVQRGAGGVPKHNLPAQRNGFIGRETALAEAMKRLQGTRLLTLIGIGGTGKTRLAGKLAERCLELHPDGVWWVDLAPLEGAEQLVPAIAQALELKLPDHASPAQALVLLLRERELLLVLDNGEHLVEPLAALVETLLEGAARLKLLVTSREALAIDAESVLPVQPLALPGPRASTQAIGESEAVQLFVERAVKVAPGFALDEDNAAVVAEVCRRVDGIPLALELAAAHLCVVAPAQLLELLQQRFEPLTRQQRRALPRQQTLHAVIQWSFDRLAPAEQQLLCALSVCGGGCDLAAAAALVGEDVASEPLLRGLSRLAEQSLLAVQHVRGRTRYLLLETVRQFALDRLQDRGAADAMRHRHARHFLGVAEDHDEEIARHGEGAAVLAMLDLDRDNLLRALDWCQGGTDVDRATTGLRLANALRYYWPARGLNALGVEVTRVALARAALCAPDLAQSRALGVITQAYWRMGRHDEALLHAQRHRQLAALINDHAGLTVACANAGNIERSLGHLDAARVHLETALRIANEHGGAALRVQPVHGLAVLALARGAAVEADQRFAELLGLRRQQGHGYNLMVALLNAASAAVELGHMARSIQYLREAMLLQDRVGSRLLSQYLVELSSVCLLQGNEAARAVTLYASSFVQRAQTNLPLSDQSIIGRVQRSMKIAREQLGEEAFEAAWAKGVALDHETTLALVRESLRE
jgi:predicted ATPase